MAERLLLREQDLRTSEKNYRDIFNTVHDAIVVNDEYGKILETNVRSAEIMFGYERDELFFTSIEKLMPDIHPYTFTEAVALIDKAIKEGTQEFEWMCKKKTGETFWAEIAITPTSDSDEVKVLAVVRDITERKEVERMKEAMLSSVSHEMRTPLTSMLGFLEFVIENDTKGAELKD